MTSTTDIANRALTAIGTRSTIASLTEQSNEARVMNRLIQPLRGQLLRMAPWNCATLFANLAVICSAPGTPENPDSTATSWQRGLPPPPWAYEYAYPSDCHKPLWVVPQFASGFSSGIPITTAVTGGIPNFINGPPVTYKVGIDKVSPSTGLPSDTGADTKVIWTNQQNAILCYISNVTDPGVMDEQFIEAWVQALAGRGAVALTGDKKLANMLLGLANDMIQIARVGDGNEGLTIDDSTPDWIRARGVNFADNSQFGPYVNGYNWGGFLSLYS